MPSLDRTWYSSFPVRSEIAFFVMSPNWYSSPPAVAPEGSDDEEERFAAAPSGSALAAAAAAAALGTARFAAFFCGTSVRLYLGYVTLQHYINVTTSVRLYLAPPRGRSVVARNRGFSLQGRRRQQKHATTTRRPSSRPVRRARTDKNDRRVTVGARVCSSRAHALSAARRSTQRRRPLTRTRRTRETGAPVTRRYQSAADPISTSTFASCRDAFEMIHQFRDAFEMRAVGWWVARTT
jgi:hypothetical protein